MCTKILPPRNIFIAKPINSPIILLFLSSEEKKADFTLLCDWNMLIFAIEIAAKSTSEKSENNVNQESPRIDIMNRHTRRLAGLLFISLLATTMTEAERFSFLLFRNVKKKLSLWSAFQSLTYSTIHL